MHRIKFHSKYIISFINKGDEVDLLDLSANICDRVNNFKRWQNAANFIDN